MEQALQKRADASSDEYGEDVVGEESEQWIQ
jgi:hypothetical protein